MNRLHRNFTGAALAALACSVVLPASVQAQEGVPSCAAIKHIVAAAPGKFSALGAADARSAAQPYGDGTQCSTGQSGYQCLWTPPGPAAGALQGVAADIASCLPEATHDVNSPARQHFYIGERGARTEVSASTVGSAQLRLLVSRQ